MVTVKKLSMVIAGAVFSVSCLGLKPVNASHTLEGDLPHRESTRSAVEDYLIVPPDPNVEGYYEPSGGLYNILVDSNQTGTSTLFNFIIPPGGGTVPHTHHRDDEVFYVLSGDLSVLLVNDDTEQTLTAGPGSFVYLPLGRPHSFSNNSTETVSTLSFFAPGGIENFFRFIGRPKELGPGGPDFTYDNIVQQYPEEFARIQFSLPVTLPGAKDFVVVPPEAQVGPYTSLVTAQQTTGGRFSASVLSLTSQSALPPLTQSSNGEYLYVLDGGLTVQLGDEIKDVSTGTTVYIAPNAPYAFTNQGSTPAKLLSLSVASVPEPSSWLGLVGVGAYFGASWLLKRKPANLKN